LHRLGFINNSGLSPAFQPENHLCQKIPNKQTNSSPRDLRLVVHGSKGGRIHPLFNYLFQQVKLLRRSNVDIEVLTAEKPSSSSSSSIWLVPLLLLPGNHFQNDIPKIYERLINEGVSTSLLPFLGCWPHWLSILKYLVYLESKASNPVLIHHPLANEIGLNHLVFLKKILKIPVIPWTEWQKYTIRSKKHNSPIPFCFTPNKNTKGLRQEDSISSLLEIDFFLFSLIHSLTLLP
tara:strand:- start:1931 stop:2635 length:705 start_codon:yes stop_codon:yes gene_type:complete